VEDNRAKSLHLLFQLELVFSPCEEIHCCSPPNRPIKRRRYRTLRKTQEQSTSEDSFKIKINK
jgi:hypothetical protein